VHAAYPQTKVQLCIVHLVREASKKWTKAIHHWKEALNHFAIMFEGRMPGTKSK
jgi:transposase-like protein